MKSNVRYFCDKLHLPKHHPEYTDDGWLHLRFSEYPQVVKVNPGLYSMTAEIFPTGRWRLVQYQPDIFTLELEFYWKTRVAAGDEFKGWKYQTNNHWLSESFIYDWLEWIPEYGEIQTCNRGESEWQSNKTKSEVESKSSNETNEVNAQKNVSSKESSKVTLKSWFSSKLPSSQDFLRNLLP